MLRVHVGKHELPDGMLTDGGVSINNNTGSFNS